MTFDAEQRTQLLRRSAEARTAAATERANKAIAELNKRGEPVNFRRVARKGQVSLDFLYRNTQLRETITRLRSRHQSASAAPVEPDPQSTIVLILTRQLRDAKAEITRLQAALAAAHGENLALRRTQKLPGYQPAQ
ncbi:transposase [Rhodococcus opacus]|nr:transposase [Rhodococcus opacus]